MALTPPTAAAFKARYPEFTALADGRITPALADAAGWVDETWREGDRDPAMLALAAHFLAVEGALSGGASAINGPVSSVKVGDVQTSFSTRGASGGMDRAGIGETAYGQRFLALRRRNFPSVTVA